MQNMPNIIYLNKHFPRLQKTDTDPSTVWTIVYYLQVEDANGNMTNEYLRQRKQISPTEKNKGNLKERMREANEAMQTIKNKMRNGYMAKREAPAPPPPTLFPTLYEALMKLQDNKSGEDYKKLLLAVANHVKTHEINKKPIDTLKKEDFEAFFSKFQDRSARTYNSYKCLIKESLNCENINLEAINKIKKRKEAESDSHQPFTDKEREDILATSLKMGMPQLYLMCQFLFYTLARPRKELRDLRISDIGENSIFFKGSTAKNGKSYA